MIHYDISPLIRAPLRKLLAEPRFIRVNRFNEDSVRELRDELDAALGTGQPVVPIVCDSYGGAVYSLLAMVDILEAAKANTTIATIVEGKAMSAAAVLLSCGEPGFRFVAPRATVMVHDASSGWEAGKVEELKASTQEAVRLNNALYELLDKNTEKERGYWRGLVDAAKHSDVYLSARQCVKHGLASDVGVPEFAVQVAVNFAFGVPTKPKAPRAKGRK